MGKYTFPNMFCMHCRTDAKAIKVDPSINEHDCRCSNCGELVKNYAVKENKIEQITYDELLSMVK